MFPYQGRAQSLNSNSIHKGAVTNIVTSGYLRLGHVPARGTAMYDKLPGCSKGESRSSEMRALLTRS
jgi:hypothetical protein